MRWATISLLCVFVSVGMVGGIWAAECCNKGSSLVGLNPAASPPRQAIVHAMAESKTVGSSSMLVMYRAADDLQGGSVAGSSIRFRPNTVLLFFTADWESVCESCGEVVGTFVAQGYPVLEISVSSRSEDRTLLVSKYGVTKLPAFVLVVQGEAQRKCEGEKLTFQQVYQMFAAEAAYAPPVKKLVPNQSTVESGLSRSSGFWRSGRCRSGRCRSGD